MFGFGRRVPLRMETVHGDNVVGFPGRLRDYYAGHALQGCLAAGMSAEGAVREAFRVADLMLEQGKKGGGDE